MILSNCFEMAGKESMSSVAARAAISLPIALFSCPYSLHYLFLRLHPVFVKRRLLNRLQSETAACVLSMSSLASSSSKFLYEAIQPSSPLPGQKSGKKPELPVSHVFVFCAQESKNRNVVPVLLVWSALSIQCQPTISLCVSLILCSKF